jgi:hypothetical protein
VRCIRAIDILRKASRVPGRKESAPCRISCPIGTSNVRNTTATNLSNTSAATLSVNSLISGGDVILANNATLTVNSGGIMMSGPNKWLQTVSNTTPAHVQAGPGVSQMVLTVLDPGQDHRIRWVIQGQRLTARRHQKRRRLAAP